jgi:hypothetical protein
MGSSSVDPWLRPIPAETALFLTGDNMYACILSVTGRRATRRERIEAAVAAGSKSSSGRCESWISADPFRGGAKVIVTGRDGFERGVAFELDEDAAVISERVRATLEE